LYIPHNNLCMDYEGVEANHIAGAPYVGASVKMYAAPGGNRGEFSAWDPVQKKKTWSLKEKFPAWSGALATAGDVVFSGAMDRWFKAPDARTGELLRQFRTGSGIIGQPISAGIRRHDERFARQYGKGGHGLCVFASVTSPAF
jgi:glucose dehydrogenase